MPKMLTIKEASEATGLSYRFIRELCLQKKIVFIKSGNKFYINAEKFAEFLNKGGEVG